MATRERLCSSMAGPALPRGLRSATKRHVHNEGVLASTSGESTPRVVRDAALPKPYRHELVVRGAAGEAAQSRSVGHDAVEGVQPQEALPVTVL
jgi:hypothetical protein